MVLEGYLLLRLISTCDKYPSWYKIKRSKGDRSQDDAKAKFEQELARKALPDLVKVNYESKKTVILIRKGLPVVDEQGNDTGVIIPYYYRAWHLYEPEKHHLKDPEVQKELLPEWAVFKSRRAMLSDVPHSELYTKFFTFESMIKNLRINGVLNRKTAVRAIVHYNFLSNFTHSTSDSVKLSQPWHNFRTVNADIAYNHYKSELALLYICHLLAMHLELALFYFQRWRSLQINETRKFYRALCKRVNQEFGYFWFIFNDPHELDKYEQANRKSSAQKGIIYRPEDIKCRDIGYNPDPLERLKRLHCSTRELSTGNVFDSPFHREDAIDPL
jgi:hypothetical protein